MLQKLPSHLYTRLPFCKPRIDYRAASEYREVLRGWDHRNTADLQLRLLQDVWRDCVVDVPYYERLVRDGRAPREIRGWDDFHAIPVLTRAILQKHGAQFRRRSGPADFCHSTAGSTGDPMTFGLWRTEKKPVRLMKLVPWIELGYKPESRLFLIWGHSHLLGTGAKRLVKHCERKLGDLLLGYDRVDAYSLNPAKAERIARRLIRFRPCGLIGYAAALDYFVRTTTKYHDRFRKLGLKFVMPAAEGPPKPDTFALIKDVFACPIVQEFGGVDFGQVAMQIGDADFEVFPHFNILEVQQVNSGVGSEQAAVVTSLYRRYLPLIRYQQGGALDSPVCQEHGHVSRFKRIMGRVNDSITLDSGNVVHSVAFFHCIHQESEVYNIQAIRNREGFTIRLVTQGALAGGTRDRIRGRLKQVDPSLGTARLEAVADVKTNLAGKRRWFIDERDQ